MAVTAGLPLLGASENSFNIGGRPKPPPEETPPPAEDVLLLREIRDELKRRPT